MAPLIIAALWGGGLGVASQALSDFFNQEDPAEKMVLANRARDAATGALMEQGMSGEEAEALAVKAVQESVKSGKSSTVGDYIFAAIGGAAMGAGGALAMRGAGPLIGKLKPKITSTPTPATAPATAPVASPMQQGPQMARIGWNGRPQPVATKVGKPSATSGSQQDPSLFASDPTSKPKSFYNKQYDRRAVDPMYDSPVEGPPIRDVSVDEILPPIRKASSGKSVDIMLDDVSGGIAQQGGAYRANTSADLASLNNVFEQTAAEKAMGLTPESAYALKRLLAENAVFR